MRKLRATLIIGLAGLALAGCGTPPKGSCILSDIGAGVYTLWCGGPDAFPPGLKKFVEEHPDLRVTAMSNQGSFHTLLTEKR